MQGPQCKDRDLMYAHETLGSSFLRIIILQDLFVHVTTLHEELKMLANLNDDEHMLFPCTSFTAENTEDHTHCLTILESPLCTAVQEMHNNYPTLIINELVCQMSRPAPLSLLFMRFFKSSPDKLLI